MIWIRVDHYNETALRQAVEELARKLDISPRDYDILSDEAAREELAAQG